VPEQPITPDLDDVNQEDVPSAPVPPVPVTIEGPTRTQSLPPVAGVARTIALSETAEPIAGRDRTRSRLVLISTTDDFYFGTTARPVEEGCLWPAAVPCEIFHSDQVWVAATAATTLAFFTEHWAH
jgi:hypothetical protein